MFSSPFLRKQESYKTFTVIPSKAGILQNFHRHSDTSILIDIHHHAATKSTLFDQFVCAHHLFEVQYMGDAMLQFII